MLVPHAEKMPSSVKVGVRPMRLRMCAYSCAVRPWAAARAALTRGSIGLLTGPVASARGLAPGLSFVLCPDFRFSFSGGACVRNASRVFLDPLAMGRNANAALSHSLLRHAARAK